MRESRACRRAVWLAEKANDEEKGEKEEKEGEEEKGKEEEETPVWLQVERDLHFQINK